ncbi:LacI family DNA-binding transcriptional regulator [Melghirimyces algeriensis]|uniref:Transcriptional regulator, LacI family n=1 Tax=Melghirimyces algeriensis TaxID=910412 RepID=A0A521EZ30_9BACL|nr:LacI family DNA-binding transcriptional regulator [Melghirimyces algeriensis]SMO89272.1 transcriptional regulator, LacI family [Melghirimyces algeriensis]
MSTIKDVAKVAGVSPSTVSRVIAGNRRISKKTRLRVQRAMAELNYVPNAIARSLARSHTRTIGFTISRAVDQAFSNPFFSEVLRGMSSVAQMHDYNILLSISMDPKEEMEKCLRLIQERRVDGLILSTSRLHDPLIAALSEDDVPFVVMGRSVDLPVLSVNNDNVKAGYHATMHLIEQGYCNIAFLSGPKDLVVSMDRFNGYKQAMSEKDLPLDSQRVVFTELTEQGGFDALEQLKEQGVLFDAVLAADDLLALGAFQFAKHFSISVPEDLGIVGFNDTPVMEYMTPSLTSVRILSYDLGAEVVDLLINHLENPDKRRAKKEIVLPSELIIRDSSRRKKD